MEGNSEQPSSSKSSGASIEPPVTLDEFKSHVCYMRSIEKNAQVDVETTLERYFVEFYRKPSTRKEYSELKLKPCQSELK